MKKYQLIILFVVILSLLSLPSVYIRTEYEKANNLLVSGVVLSEFKDTDTIKEDTAVIRETEGVFDTHLLNRAERICSSIALEFNADRKNDGFVPSLYDLTKKYNVKYLILREGIKKEQDTQFVSSLCTLIKEKSLILVLKENETQNGNELPFGIEAFLTASGMRILRAYEPSSQKTACIQMLNSVIDRNTEFIISDTPSELQAVKKLKEKLKSRTQEEPEGFLTHPVPLRIVYALAAAVTLLFILYIYLFLSVRKIKMIIYTLYIMIPVLFTAVFFLPSAMLGFIRTVYVSSVPCFMLTVVLGLCRKNSFSFKIRFSLVVFTAFFLSIVCGTLTGALFSGWMNHLCFIAFPEVVITLIIPIVYTGFLWHHENKDGKFTNNKLLSLAFLVIIAFYLVRSGNTEITSAERILRNFLSDLFVIRPRLKEFLFGWPCLFAAPFVLKKEKSSVLTGLVLFGCTVLFSSVINSFCHGFTDITTSYLRVVWGFVAAIPVSLLGWVGFKCRMQKA